MKGWLNHAKKGLFGSHHNTEDSDFDSRAKFFTIQINELSRTKEAIELWLDSFESFSASTVLLHQTFRQIYSQDEIDHNQYHPQANIPDRKGYIPSPYNEIVLTFEKIAIDMDTIIRPTIKDMVKSRCLDPIANILGITPKINEQITERKKLLQENISCKNKLDKESSKQGIDISIQSLDKVDKLAARLKTLGNSLALIHAEISESFDLIESNRPKMFINQLSSCIAIFSNYFGTGSYLYGKLLPFIPNSYATIALLSNQVPIDDFSSTLSINSLNAKIKENSNNNLSSMSEHPSIKSPTNLLKSVESIYDCTSTSVTSSSSNVMSDEAASLAEHIDKSLVLSPANNRKVSINMHRIRRASYISIPSTDNTVDTRTNRSNSFDTASISTIQSDGNINEDSKADSTLKISNEYITFASPPRKPPRSWIREDNDADRDDYTSDSNPHSNTSSGKINPPKPVRDLTKHPLKRVSSFTVDRPDGKILKFCIDYLTK